MFVYVYMNVAILRLEQFGVESLAWPSNHLSDHKIGKANVDTVQTWAYSPPVMELEGRQERKESELVNNNSSFRSKLSPNESAE